MISTLDSLTELEQCHRARALAVECYAAAIHNMAHYAVDLEPDITDPHKQYLSGLGKEVAAGEEESLIESRASLRGLLRDYGEKAAKFLGNLHEKLAANARALEEIMEVLAQADGDQGVRLSAALGRLREIAALPEGGQLRPAVQAAVDTIEKSLEEMQKQHQLTISQFQVEVRMLHKRIDSLENAAAVDGLTKLFNRGEMQTRIRSMDADSSLLLIRMNGLRLAETKYTPVVAKELAGAFTKRLRNTLAPAAVIGRWGHEEFLAIVPSKKAEALAIARWIAEHLSGPYACILNGKAVRPSLQLSVGVAEHGGEASSERLTERVSAFFHGG